MTQQEIKAVEDYADKISQEPPCSVQSISIQLENRGYLHGLYNGVIQGAQFLDEIRKPSEPETYVGEASEELIKDIEGVIDSRKWRSLYHNRYMLHSDDFKSVATEIAALMQPDKELLEEMYEALIIARDRIGVSTGYPREIAIAISNYEKRNNGVQICYKTNEPCKHGCDGLCKESC